jgi:hypothetical protein
MWDVGNAIISHAPTRFQTAQAQQYAYAGLDQRELSALSNAISNGDALMTVVNRLSSLRPKQLHPRRALYFLNAYE